MSLVADYSSSSSSLSECDLEKQDIKTVKCSTTSTLPSAYQLLTSATLKNTGDVFKNPFLDAENAKFAVLEKHVKMVNKDEHQIEKNGRKICWNYRKGRCRFGSKCSYAHDSDLSTISYNSVSDDILLIDNFDSYSNSALDLEQQRNNIYLGEHINKNIDTPNQVVSSGRNRKRIAGKSSMMSNKKAKSA